MENLFEVIYFFVNYQFLGELKHFHNFGKLLLGSFEIYRLNISP